MAIGIYMGIDIHDQLQSVIYTHAIPICVDINQCSIRGVTENWAVARKRTVDRPIPRLI